MVPRVGTRQNSGHRLQLGFTIASPIFSARVVHGESDMASIERQGKSWKATIRRSGYPTQSKSFALKSAAEQWARQTELEMTDGKYITVSKKNVQSLFEKFRDEVCPERKGCRWEKVRINAFIRDIDWMKLPVNKMSDEVLTKWKDDRLKQVTPATVNREMNLLSTVFQHARQVWKIKMQENPIKLVKRPPKGKDRTRRITDEELTAVVDYCNGATPESATWYAGKMFAFAIETAMRLGEISGLLWDDVDTEKRFLVVRDSKNSDSRHVPLSTNVIKLLESLPKNDPFVFPANKDSVGTMFRRATGALGIVDLHFHDTRHEGTSRLAKKFNVMELAKIIGHRDINSLMIYYNPTVEDLAGKLD